MPKYRTALLLVAILSFAPAVARAQGDTDLAKGYYKLGVELYNRADYEEALAQFNKAYKHSRKATLFHNIARCHESLGQHEQAVLHYERYLKEGKPADAEMIKARIANLKRLIEKKKAAQPKPGPKPPVVKPTSQPVVKPGPKPPVVKPQPTPIPIPPPPRSRPLRTAGWVMVGAGGASLIAGLIFGGLAADMADTLEKQNKANPAVEYDADIMADEETGRTLQAVQILTLAVGGAAVATGVVLLILDRRKQSKERRVWLAPVITPGGALVSGGLRF